MPPKPKTKVATTTAAKAPKPPAQAAVLDKGGRPKGQMLEDSMPVRMLNTPVGGCQAIASTLDIGMPSQIMSIKTSLLNTLRAASIRAGKKDPAMTWRGSTTDYRDPDGRLVIVAVLTRVA